MNFSGATTEGLLQFLRKRMNANIPNKLAIKIMAHSDNVGMDATELTGAA